MSTFYAVGGHVLSTTDTFYYILNAYSDSNVLNLDTD